MSTNLLIGDSEQGDSLEYLLGQPLAIRTDNQGNIYVADRASLTIKVFDQEGNYIKSLGGRGRGPAEFYDINLMELTPEGNFIILDRGNLRYTTIDKEGDYVSSFTINLQDQFYLQDIDYVDDKLIGMDISSHSANSTNPSEIFSRNIFHVYSKDLQTLYSSFAPVHQLGIQDWFGWNLIDEKTGSSTYIEDINTLLLSPGTYTGKLYLYKNDSNSQWKLTDSLTATAPFAEPYILYDTEKEFEKAIESRFPGVAKISFSGRGSMGRLKSFDAGIFYLPKRKLIVQFYAEWREGNVSIDDGHLLDLSMQVLDLDGNILDQSYLMSMEYNPVVRYYSLVNWMDENENFYMVDFSTNEPLIRRFSLDLPKNPSNN